ncbi:MAG: lysoplasmalogenase [Caldilineaceae bacterium]
MIPLILATAVVVVSGTLHILAEYNGRRWHVYLLKPLTTWTILLVAVLANPDIAETGRASFYQSMIIGGLVFSLAGDVFLMLPQDRFIPGLFSFLVAHLLYIAAFTNLAGLHNRSGWLYWPFLLIALLMLAYLWRAVGKLRIYVIAYMLVISVMAWQGAEYWFESGTTASAVAAVGALLFLVSDSVLAIDRFRTKFATASIVVLSTYYVAQLLIAWSVRGS